MSDNLLMRMSDKIKSLEKDAEKNSVEILKLMKKLRETEADLKSARLETAQWKLKFTKGTK